MLIIHGQQDTVTPVSQARRLAAELGSRATLVTFPDETHGLRHPDHTHHARTVERDHYRQVLRL